MKSAVDKYIDGLKIWKEETKKVRAILLDCGLQEDIKWGKPCYSFNNKNIVVVQGFKKYFAILFFNGYLLKDAKNVLVKTGPNTKVGRQLRFENVAQIDEMKSTIKDYVHEMIEIEKAKK